MYYLDLPLSWQIYNAFHTLLLSLYHEIREYRTNYLRLTLALVEGEPEWEVKWILASRCHRWTLTAEMSLFSTCFMVGLHDVMTPFFK